jgi:hypothetical protein
MPYRSSLDTKRRVAMSEFYGSVTYADIETYCYELRTTTGFESTYSQLVDALGATQADLHAEDMKRLRTLDAFSPDSMRVIVVASEHMFGLARMYELMLDSPKFRVVKTRAEAMKFLGVEGGDVSGS